MHDERSIDHVDTKTIWTYRDYVSKKKNWRRQKKRLQYRYKTESASTNTSLIIWNRPVRVGDVIDIEHIDVVARDVQKSARIIKRSDHNRLQYTLENWNMLRRNGLIRRVLKILKTFDLIEFIQHDINENWLSLDSSDQQSSSEKRDCVFLNKASSQMSNDTTLVLTTIELKYERTDKTRHTSLQRSIMIWEEVQFTVHLSFSTCLWHLEEFHDCQYISSESELVWIESWIQFRYQTSELPFITCACSIIVLVHVYLPLSDLDSGYIISNDFKKRSDQSQNHVWFRKSKY